MKPYMFKTALKITLFLEKQHKVVDVKSTMVVLVAFLGSILNAVLAEGYLFILNMFLYYPGSGNSIGTLDLILAILSAFLESIVMNGVMVLLTSAVLGFIMSLFLKHEHISLGKSFQLMLLHSFLVSLFILIPLPGIFIFVYLIGGMIARTILVKNELKTRTETPHFTPLPQKTPIA